MISYPTVECGTIQLIFLVMSSQSQRIQITEDWDWLALPFWRASEDAPEREPKLPMSGAIDRSTYRSDLKRSFHSTAGSNSSTINETSSVTDTTFFADGVLSQTPVMNACLAAGKEKIMLIKIVRLPAPKDYDFDNQPSLELEHFVDPTRELENSLIIDYYNPIAERPHDT